MKFVSILFWFRLAVFIGNPRLSRQTGPFCEFFIEVKIFKNSFGEKNSASSGWKIQILSQEMGTLRALLAPPQKEPRGWCLAD